MKGLFQIQHIREIQFSLNREVAISNNLQNHLKLSVLFILKYQDNSDIIALHALARFTYDDEKLSEGGATFIAKVDEWNAIGHTPEELKDANWVKQLISYAYAFISGLYFRYTEGTVLNNAFLPYIPSDELASMLHVESVSPDQE